MVQFLLKWRDVSMQAFCPQFLTKGKGRMGSDKVRGSSEEVLEVVQWQSDGVFSVVGKR